MIIRYSSRFIKELKKLSKEKQLLAIKREEMFRKDPFDPRLKTHKLSGSLQDYWAFSLTYSDRVLFRFISFRGLKVRGFPYLKLSSASQLMNRGILKPYFAFIPALKERGFGEAVISKEEAIFYKIGSHDIYKV